VVSHGRLDTHAQRGDVARVLVAPWCTPLAVQFRHVWRVSPGKTWCYVLPVTLSIRSCSRPVIPIVWHSSILLLRAFTASASGHPPCSHCGLALPRDTGARDRRSVCCLYLSVPRRAESHQILSYQRRALLGAA